MAAPTVFFGFSSQSRKLGAWLTAPDVEHAFFRDDSRTVPHMYFYQFNQIVSLISIATAPGGVALVEDFLIS
jgi:hypothetical protein